MTRGLPTRLPRTHPPVADRLRDGPVCVSYEFFPPRDDEGEQRLWAAIRELEPLNPAFVSVTYGAGGSTRERTVRLTERIAAETIVQPVAHLTCVGHSRSELRAIIGQYADAEVTGVLALRGDPPGGPGTPWRRHPDGFDHAIELVEMLVQLGDFSVGVAAFPRGHPQSVDLDADARVLAAKARAGARFAVTQLFFRAEEYARLIDQVAALGCDIPILPGVMPITSLRQIDRLAELSGSPVPIAIASPLERLGPDPAAVRAAGIDIATSLCSELLDLGAPGLHFYTLNHSRATRQIQENLSSRIG